MERISNIDDYMKEARKTAVYGTADYPLAALSEEVGEVMGKIAKFGRKNRMNMEQTIMAASEPHTSKSEELREMLRKEMGDVMWQWVMLCSELNFMPSEILTENIAKLTDRQERNVLNGEGDNR